MTIAKTYTEGRASWLAPVGLLTAASVAGVAYFLRAQQALTGNLWGVPLDDAYIHFQFARNLATGHGFAFNPDQPIPGSTSPLWVLLLAGGSMTGLPLWAVAKLLGVAFLAASAVLAWRLAAGVTMPPTAAVAAGALTALNGRLLWATPSGMEVTLFTALSLGALVARPRESHPDTSASGGRRNQSARRVVLTALLCGLAAQTRPEGYLLTVILAVDIMRRVRPAWGLMAVAGLVYAALALPYIVFCMLTTGRILPTTFYAKSIGLGPWTASLAANYLKWLIFYGLLTNPAALVLAPLGAVVLWRARGWPRAIVAWPLALVVYQALFAPLVYQFGRYEMVIEPLLGVMAVVGMARLARGGTPAESLRATMPPLALVLVGALTLNTWSSLYAHSVQEINTMQVGLGRWVASHVPRGAAVALNDIGAITFVGRHPAIDVVGLVTPRFIALQRESPPGRAARDVFAEIERRGAAYLIIFPAWYPQLAALPGLHPVYSVTIAHPVVVGAPTMTVYALPHS